MGPGIWKMLVPGGRRSKQWNLILAHEKIKDGDSILKPGNLQPETCRPGSGKSVPGILATAKSILGTW